MSGFKLLGIRTRNRISEKENPETKDYLKILKENKYYSFYNSFNYDIKTESLTYDPDKEIDLYSFQIDDSDKIVDLNISAIVGKNGSGKSTLIELLFLAIHNIASHCEILKSPDDDTLWYTETGVKLDLFYQIDATVYCIRMDDLEVEISSATISKEIQEYTFQNFKDFTKLHCENFFYSIAINYSIYSLNTRHVGDWIRALFHKNDGYQTPVVINPMRDEGNININREEYLSKSRLLANLLVKTSSNDHLKLTKNQKVTGLRFELNKKKIKNLYENRRLEVPIIWTFEQLYSDYSNESAILSVLYENLIELDRDKVNVPFKKEVEQYIIKKIFKIARTYDNYKKFLNTHNGIFGGSEPTVYSTNGNIQPKFYNVTNEDENADRNLTEFIKALKKDKSHITFKLNQAINYLHKNPLKENDELKWIEADNTSLFSISVSELSNRISISDGAEIINFIPPSLFNVEIFLEEIGDSSKNSRFGSLSSGEQQLIQSVQSIIYHINNLNSVFSNNNEDIKYPYINILLDEIELYFHPEFQRIFVSTLLDNIKTAHLDKISSINILFSTHSPFILSDIPSSNILRLKDGEPEQNGVQTFGANIYDLLADDFFMNEGFIGEYAMGKIKEVLDYIHLKHYKSEKHVQALKITSLIGEESIRLKLSQMLDDLSENQANEDDTLLELKAKKDILEKEIKKIEDKNDKSRQ